MHNLLLKYTRPNDVFPVRTAFFSKYIFMLCGCNDKLIIQMTAKANNDLLSKAMGTSLKHVF